MTSAIQIEGIKNIIKPTAVKWKRSITDYSDTATITLPAIAMLKTTGDVYKRVETGLQFSEGLKVDIACGYNGNNPMRFRGFIRRINPKIPLELECEGYSYQLRKMQNFNGSYKAGINLKTILNDLVRATDIKLSQAIPDITIDTALSFPNLKGTEVLDWFKEKMLMTVHFNFNELYVGLAETQNNKAVKFRLGWNVVQDDELKFNDKRELADVKIVIGQKGKDGKNESSSEADNDNKNLKRLTLPVRVDKATMNKIADDQKKKIQSRGYEGAFTAFLLPDVEPGMAVEIQDTKYPTRSGKYFVEATEGDYSTSGGRQKIKIGPGL